MTGPDSPAGTDLTGTLTAPAPVAGLLAAWGSAWLAGAAAADDVVAVVDPHALTVVDGPDGAGGLLDLLASWRRAGTTRLATALVRPGDPVGLPADGPYAAAARTAGQGVHALDGSPTLAAVPTVTAHGNAVEGVVHSVRWQVLEVGPTAPPPVQVSEAAQELRLALVETTRALASLDVARWRPDAAGPVEEMRRARGREHRFPPGWPERAGVLLGEAHRLGVVLGLGSQDAGGAVTAAEMQQRAAALAGLGRAVHRARLAGWNAHLEPRRG